MEFNKNWTKEDNKKMREMIKMKISPDKINEFFGNDKLFYHPNKKYYNSSKSSLPSFKEKIFDFSGFINEIKYEPLKTDFIYDYKKSDHFKDEFDYIYRFQTNSGNRYIIDFIYLNDNIGPFPKRDIYNISFTLEENHNLSNHIDYEKQTLLNESSEIVKRIIFILQDFNMRFGEKCIYLLGETVDKRKINWYRNLIKDSFNNVKETIGISSYTNGLTAYYYEIQE